MTWVCSAHIHINSETPKTWTITLKRYKWCQEWDLAGIELHSLMMHVHCTQQHDFQLRNDANFALNWCWNRRYHKLWIWPSAHELSIEKHRTHTLRHGAHKIAQKLMLMKRTAQKLTVLLRHWCTQNDSRCKFKVNIVNVLCSRLVSTRADYEWAREQTREQERTHEHEQTREYLEVARE